MDWSTNSNGKCSRVWIIVSCFSCKAVSFLLFSKIFGLCFPNYFVVFRHWRQSYLAVGCLRRLVYTLNEKCCAEAVRCLLQCLVSDNIHIRKVRTKSLALLLKVCLKITFLTLLFFLLVLELPLLLYFMNT